MKNIVIGITIFLIGFLIIFFCLNSGESEIKNKSLSIILETEEGNIESNAFPSKYEYVFSDIRCENTSDKVDVSFNSETWKLNLSVEEESVDGSFNCIVYFKESGDIATKIIKEKYDNGSTDIMKLDQPSTDQTPALTEYRYSGSEVNNYVLFNNELWRIIGVFTVDDGLGNYEERVKIIRDESIGDYPWDTSDAGVNDGSGVSQWGESGNYEGADIMRLLNPDYESESINNSLYWNRGSGTCYSFYNNATSSCDFSNVGLTSESKQMIDEVKWYTGTLGGGYYNVNTSNAYLRERGTFSWENALDGVVRTDSWIGYVGLMYASDYGYASSVCYKDVLLNNSDVTSDDESLEDYRQEKCTSSNWLYDSKSVQQYTITPYYNNVFFNNVRTVSGHGNLDALLAGGKRGVRPSVYLKTSVKITYGDGSINNPYRLR